MMMKDSTLSFRIGVENDIPKILKFIKELAAYEKMLDKVAATEESLKKWLFEEKIAEVLFVLEDGKEVGYALFFYNFSTFTGCAGLYVEDLFVSPECRGKGYGKKLLQELARLAMEKGCARMEWQCLNWNQPSLDFYKSLGAVIMQEWLPLRVEGKALGKLAQAHAACVL